MGEGVTVRSRSGLDVERANCGEREAAPRSRPGVCVCVDSVGDWLSVCALWAWVGRPWFRARPVASVGVSWRAGAGVRTVAGPGAL